MVSIIIPLYNHADKLDGCLASIANQTSQNFEITVVNDGSTDNYEPIIKKFKERFGYKFIFLSQENKGAPAARNLGARNARGEFLLFCDADVIMKPEALEMMLKTLQDNPGASYAYSSFLWGHKLFRLWPWSAERLKLMPYIMTTSLIRREHFPGFDEKLKRLQDWDLWLTMLEKGYTGVWIDQVLFKVRTGGVYSSWLPSFAYKLLPFLPAVRKYKRAEKIIKEKHHLQ